MLFKLIKSSHINNVKFIFLLLFLFSFQNISCQEKDSITPFKKGRWLTGLSGSFASYTSILDNDNKVSTNTYGLELTTGNFFKDRWLIGGLLSAERVSGGGKIERGLETFFIAPTIAFYLSKNYQGSLFISISPGYIRFREETIINLNEEPIIERIEGPGFGARLSLGYSYVIHNRIAFDIGLNVNNYWLNTKQESLPLGSSSKESIMINGINFFFGFNVLLDDFFF